jgi:hypothetical protein
VLRTLILLAAALALALPARADDEGGIFLSVTDQYGKTLTGVRVSLFRLGGGPALHASTNGSGRVINITLEPGTYFFSVENELGVQDYGCGVANVYGNEVSRARLVVWYNQVRDCSGHVQPTLVDPNQTGDLYRI